MIFPRKWLFERPGTLIPVFFLSLATVTLPGQLPGQFNTLAYPGSSGIIRSVFPLAGLDQSGLGWNEQHGVTFQHLRPFLLKELGISSFSILCYTGTGSLDITLTTSGINGLRQTELWIAYGMKLYPALSAGIAIHGWGSGIKDQIVVRPGISFAAGAEARLNDKWTLGTHLLHPAGWSAAVPGSSHSLQMIISAGFSYRFFNSAIFRSAIHIRPEGHIRITLELEWKPEEKLGVTLGTTTGPFSYRAGVTVKQKHWIIELAIHYLYGSGMTPSTTFSHVW